MNWRLLLLSALLPVGVSAQTTTTFVPLLSAWKYLDNGSNQGSAWLGAGFNDSNWAQGPGELGYGDGGEATIVSFGPNSGAKIHHDLFPEEFYGHGSGGLYNCQSAAAAG